MTKVKYRTNGDIAELSEEATRKLVDAGICDVVAADDETQTNAGEDAVPTPKATPKAPAPSTTKVEPLTTQDVPQPPTAPAKPATGKPTRRPKGK